MGPVYELNGYRLIDLTKVLDPATESRRCHLIRYNTGGPIPDFHTALDLTSHLGTHCECPSHHFEDGASVGDLPLTTFMGRALYVTLDLPENDAVYNSLVHGPSVSAYGMWCETYLENGTPYQAPTTYDGRIHNLRCFESGMNLEAIIYYWKKKLGIIV